MKPYVIRLYEAQFAFMQALPKLLDKATKLGYFVSAGDMYRDPRSPYGSKSSKHHVRLAIDLNLFEWREGNEKPTYLQATEDHQVLGEYWESLGGIWGGRFEDGNHYEWPL